MKYFRSVISGFLLAALTVTLSGQTSKAITTQEVIDLIIKQVGIEPIPNTVDVIKAGDPSTPVTGIATTMFATMDVLKKAVELNCNLIVCHEPVFYNHRDDTKPFMNDPVYLEKQKYIDDHKLVIWRFHDYIHRLKPDAIDYGMALKLGWLKYTDGVTVERFVLPETTLNELVQSLRKVFPQNTFHVIGNPEMKLTKAAFSAGAPGSAVHYAMLKDNDVVIAGETVQWETYEYVRDAVQQGRNKAIIFLGHVTSEEPGMEYCAEWLKGLVKDIPVKFVESGPSFRTY
ncbi:MAG: Nif3-like dinuclear metal center hexameric protein [Bacteroidota bacterium]